MLKELIRFLVTQGRLNYGRMSRTVRALGVTLLMSGCTGYISQPIPTAPSLVSLECPVLGPTIPHSRCPGLRLNNVILTCGGGKVPFTITTTPVGTDRFAATLADGSVVMGSATPVDGRCFDGFTVQIGVTFGVLYAADKAVEPVGPTAGSPCIFRSRADFTQFVTTDPILLHPGVEDWIKGEIHKKLDAQIIESIYQTSGAPTLPARCARWRPL